MNKYQSQTFLFPSFELMVRTGYLALLWFNRCHGVKRRTLHFESLSLSRRTILHSRRCRRCSMRFVVGNFVSSGLATFLRFMRSIAWRDSMQGTTAASLWMLNFRTAVWTFNEIPAAILGSTCATQFLGVGVAASNTIVSLSGFNNRQECSIASTNRAARTLDIELTALVFERHVVSCRVE